jgi:Na+-driven multidrug efflux pump
MWLVRIPAAAVLAVVFRAPIVAVWSVMILDWIARMALLTWRYRKWGWERLRV